MIGIFDSGVGGMTVACALEKAIPGQRLIYFGDLARTPYGSKSADTILNYSIQNTEFLIAKGAKAIVIACNSAASVASEVLKSRFSVPIFEVISPAIAQAVKSTTSGRIGVIGTRATIRSGIYEKKIKLLNPAARVFPQACPLLVPLVEEGWLNKRETKMILRRYLQPLRAKQIDTLVLGCTHYPLLKELIGPRIGKKRVALIDSSAAVAGEVKGYLDANPEMARPAEQQGENIYYVSDVTEAAAMIARQIFGREIKLVKA